MHKSYLKFDPIYFQSMSAVVKSQLKHRSAYILFTFTSKVRGFVCIMLLELSLHISCLCIIKSSDACHINLSTKSTSDLMCHVFLIFTFTFVYDITLILCVLNLLPYLTINGAVIRKWKLEMSLLVLSPFQD